MGISDRPYIGSWRLNGTELVQMTPDALVYLNGDTALPGCPKCSGRIDIQKFITEVSVDAGTDPGSASASFSLSIPLHHGESFARDAKFLLRPGLEVHVYMRGYFPVKGLYSNLAEARVQQDIGGAAILRNITDVDANQVASKFTPDAIPPTQPMTEDDVQDWANRMGVNVDVLSAAIVLTSESGRKSEWPFITDTMFNRQLQQGGSIFSIVTSADGGKNPRGTTGSQKGVTYDSTLTPDARNISSIIPVVKATLTRRASGDTTGGITHFTHPGAQDVNYAKDPASNPSAQDVHESRLQDFDEVNVGLDQERIRFYGTKAGRRPIGTPAEIKAQSETALTNPEAVQSRLEELDRTGGLQLQGEVASQVTTGPSLLDELGLQGQGIEDTIAYPYYHVFHGVVTEVSHSYSGGVSSISVNCSSMLHFWQYQNMSTNASVFGARPTNSKNKMSMVGHNFTGMHPYQIMYTLHHDMVGAAGGVGWALSNKTNQTAVSEVGGESLFSLNIRYWEKRFQGSMIKLRMHGATGELFTTMQSAFLGRTSSSRLTGLLRNRFNTSKLRGTDKGIMEQATSVGLFNANRRSAIESTIQGRSRDGGVDNAPRFEINIVEMQAFVSNIGNWGQINLFESSYESKLDIAQKVMEITGFEFYQDVDGDFVFKPPMYNMDTSSSRVYRIEDIDIINISFSEKEPQVTYMTVKGSQFKNLQGTGAEGEWGVRGQYIDYRLVAQFGWRPGSYETAYFNDAKSMFFAAMNRMDILNIGINSASVTIPVRPEFRPGYPVYIPYLDCFYYCNSFAHSHSVGGQCTTSLQLVGKRAKFFAPGHTTNAAKQGINAIDLGETTLPERPLEVIGTDGKPRLAGFPNVVMALDPSGINPLFFVVGADLENFEDERVVKYLLDTGVQTRVLKKIDLGDGRAFYTMPASSGNKDGEGNAKQIAFYFQEGDLTGTAVLPDEAPFKNLQGTGGPQVSQRFDATINVMAAAIEYSNLLKTRAEEKEGENDAVLEIQFKINGLQAEIAELNNSPKRHTDASIKDEIEKKFRAIGVLEKRQQKKANDADAKQLQLESSWKDPSKQEGVAFLLEMLNAVGDQFRSSDEFKGRGDLSSTINLLDMLSDKKATFSNGTQPGVYRYYSASHPDPKHQGPRTAKYDKNKMKESAPLPVGFGGDPDPRYPNDPITTFATVPVAPFEGARVPEASFEQKKPVNGVKVLTSNPKFPGGQVIATSDIMELMFTVQDITIVKQVGTSWSTTNTGSIGKKAREAIVARFTVEAIGRSPGADESLLGFFAVEYIKLTTALGVAITAMQDAATAKGKAFAFAGAARFPTTVPVNGVSVDVNAVIDTFNYSGNTGEDLTPLGASGPKTTRTQFVNRGGAGFGSTFSSEAEAVRRRAAQEMKKLGFDTQDHEEVLTAFSNSLASTLGASVSTRFRGHGTKARKTDTTTFSPVFPVSDHAGYTVIGSYRYGRGVDIEPQGVFDQLHKVDPAALLDKNLVEQILRLQVQGKGSVTLPELREEMIGGKTRFIPTNKVVTSEGVSAAQNLNKEIVRQLRAANLTDKQILDYGLALQSNDPNQVDFSLANFFADETKDGIAKIPVINAAFSLADLTVQRGQHVCDCKAAEANVLLEAFGQSEFLPFAQAGSPHHEGIGSDPSDAGSRFVAQQAALASVPWKQSQDALRGTVLDRGRSQVVQQFQDLDEAFIQSAQTSQAARDDLQDAEDRLLDLRANLSTRSEEDV